MSPAYERYARALRYFAKSSQNKVYVLYCAGIEVAHDDNFTQEEYEKLCDIAFPPDRERSTEDG